MGAALDPDQALMEAGLDSLAAVELCNAAAAAFGTTLPATLALDYPTLRVYALLSSCEPCVTQRYLFACMHFFTAVLQAVAGYIAANPPQAGGSTEPGSAALTIDPAIILDAVHSACKAVLAADIPDNHPFMEVWGCSNL